MWQTALMWFSGGMEWRWGYQERYISVFWYGIEILRLKFSVESVKQGGGGQGRRRERGFLVCMPRLLCSWNNCKKFLHAGSMVATQLLELLDFLIITAQDHRIPRVLSRQYILPFPEKGQIASWPSLLEMTFKLKLLKTSTVIFPIIQNYVTLTN